MERLRRFAPLLVVSLLPLASCAWLGSLFEKPRVSVRRVELGAVSFTGVSATVVFAVQNPNAIGIDLARLAYQLTVDGHAFVSGQGDRPLHVPANGVGDLALPVSFQFVELTKSIAALATKRQVPYTLSTRLGFGTPLGVIEVPLAHSGTFPVPQLPRVTLDGASARGLDAAGATVGVTLALRNDNPFALPLGALHYQLSVNGAALLSSVTPPIALGAAATQVVPLGARVAFGAVGIGLWRVLESGRADLALDGSLDLGPYRLPLHLATRLTR